MNKTIGLLLFSAAVLAAQDGVERATVPLHDPSHPPSIRVQLMNGGIIVRGADRNDVLVEARPRGRGRDENRQRGERSDGMKRLDLPGSSGLDIREENNQVTVKTSGNNGGEVVLSVPRHSSLQLKTLNDGDIVVEQVDGEIEANDLNGRITLKNVAGSVVAHSMNGAVTATLDRIDAAKPMSFSTMNGDIDITLPDALKANVSMKTDNGDIFSDFEVKINGGAQFTKNEGGRQSDGTFHLKFDRTLRGTINGGGPEFQFTTFNGQIFIRRKK